MKLIKYIILFAVVLGYFNIANSQTNLNNTDAFYNMSIEEMMNIKVVSSSFTGIDKIKAPASITVITSEDIALTPARNLYDLIEVFVPAAIWMNHYDSPHIGIRGLINQRNDKILLLVNGKNMNFKARNGATSELENWDISDIEQIEIIRGPGSVIYGPGAVEAVINITTKKYSSQDGYKLNLRNYNPYQSFGGNLSINKSLTEDINLYAFASVISSKGYNPEKGYYIANTFKTYDLGVTEDDIQFQDLFYDTYNKPQIKAHLQFDIGNNTSIWTRYTKAGTTLNGITIKFATQTGYLPFPDLFTLSEPFNFNTASNEQFVLALDNKMDLGNNFNLNTLLSFDSENNSRSQDYIQVHPEQYAPKDSSIMLMLRDRHSLRNKYFEGSESELQLRMLLTKDFNVDFTYAVGFEYSYNYWGKSWFSEDGYFRFGDNWNILSDKNSPAYGYFDFFGTDSNDTYFVGNGWSTNTISFFAEANYKLNNDITLLLSGRLDKDDYSTLMFSPRIALIWGLQDYYYLKLIAQRSVRMNTAEELLIQHLKGVEPNTENLDNIELIITRLLNENFVANLSLFYSDVDILTWKDPIRSTILSGNLKLFGVEFESRYHNDFIDIIFNHSFIKQLSWKLEPGVFESGISYSDFYKELAPADSTLPFPKYVGVGNDLNNLSNHTTKLIMNFQIIDEILFHIDSRIYWNFEGSQDGLQMMRNSLPNALLSEEKQKVIELIEKYDTFGTDFRLNASIRFNPFESIYLTIFGMNLVDLTNNRRVKYDTGSKEDKFSYIMKTSMIVEPLTIGLNLTVNF